jgi:hypothetical protein
MLNIKGSPVYIFALVSIWLMIAVPNSNAFFGLECREPRRDYERLMNESSKDKVLEDQAAQRAFEQARLARKECRRNKKAYILKKYSEQSKEMQSDLSRLGCVVLAHFGQFYSVPQGVASKNKFRKSMLIIKSYKKCFDPETYVSAVEWLSRNK